MVTTAIVLAWLAIGLSGDGVLPLGHHWRLDLPFGDRFHLVIGDARLLVATPSRLEAYTWQTGAPAWTLDTPSTVPPLIEDGRVFVTTGDAIQAVSELSGHPDWRLPTGSVTVPLVFRAGWLLAISDDGQLLGIRAADGTVLWQSPPLPTPLSLPPVVDGDRVFGVTADGDLTAWRITDGAVLWRGQVPAQPQHLLAAHGRLYVAAGGRLTAYRQTTGRQDWSYAVAMPIVSRLAADQEHVYLAVLDNSVRAHRAGNGHMAWNTKVDARVVDGLTADAGMVFVPHSDGTVRLMLASTGLAAGQLAAPAADSRGTTALITAGQGPTLRLARMTVSDTARIIDAFSRQTLRLTAATTLSGTPLPLALPGGGRPRPSPPAPTAPHRP